VTANVNGTNQFVRDSECKRIKSVTFSMNYSAALQQ